MVNQMRRRIIAGIAAAGLAVGIPAGVLALTESPASAAPLPCPGTVLHLDISHGAQPPFLEICI